MRWTTIYSNKSSSCQSTLKMFHFSIQNWLFTIRSNSYKQMYARIALYFSAHVKNCFRFHLCLRFANTVLVAQINGDKSLSRIQFKRCQSHFTVAQILDCNSVYTIQTHIVAECTFAKISFTTVQHSKAYSLYIDGTQARWIIRWEHKYKPKEATVKSKTIQSVENRWHFVFVAQSELVFCQSRFTIAFVVKGLLVIKHRSKFVEFIEFYAQSIDTHADNCVRFSFSLSNLSLLFSKSYHNNNI